MWSHVNSCDLCFDVSFLTSFIILCINNSESQFAQFTSAIAARISQSTDYIKSIFHSSFSFHPFNDENL